MKSHVLVLPQTPGLAPLLVRLVEKGDRYGLGDCLTNNTTTLVEFYDTRHPQSPYGLFISRYYLDGICLHVGELNLDGGVWSWRVTGNSMTRLRRWIKDLTESGELT